jgi:tripartite-type tricarboxylate transporter receptor subunit TctC
MKSITRRAFALAVLGTAAAGSQAQGTISIVVPFAPGGNTDLVARILAERLAPRLGTAVVVENKPGAGAQMATSYVARATPDGQTLLLTTVAHAVTPALRKTLPYDTQADFTPIYVATRAAQLMVVSPNVPAKDLREFITAMRAEPGKYSFGSSGVGSALHLAGELLRQQARVDIQHIPYKGTGQAITDVMSGQIHFIIDPISTAAQFARSGKVRAFAVTSQKRSPLLPDVPTFAESGLPGFEAYTWAMILAPKGIRQEVASRLNKAIAEVVNEPATQKRLVDLGLEPINSMSLDEASTFLREETRRWTGVIRQAGIQPE